MELFDSHCHYNDERFDLDRNEIIMQNFEDGITNAIVAGYNVEASDQAIQIANKYSHLYATARDITK